MVLVVRFGTTPPRIRTAALVCGAPVTTCYLIDRVERPYGSR